ncbi:hypothetical protein TL16_g12423 [Triparma laevis f. inornata]|uniref:FANCI solenoid 2 domain-containing protein n=1 Tax=Triparma laevis f. inornata TaxID=1714386 RepID=A0A9W7BUL8_9STRA|nr:hypothetical protein TL16_g12423 [Triparma laevis f. inornata]
MPTALATPEKDLLILLDNEPLTVETNMEISSYIEKTVAQSPDINNNLQAVLLSLTDRLLATSTELDTFNPLLSSLLNNLRVMTPQTILLVAKAITKNLAAEPNLSHQANVVNLATQLLPILASFMDPTEATKLYDGLIDFNSGYATTVCTLLREIDGGSIVRLTSEQLATALTHFTSSFAKTPPNNAPKLIYQVLLLYSSPDSGNNLTHQALDGITSWFDEHIAITTAPTPEQTFLLTASLSSFVSALRHSRSLGKTILKQITTSDSPTTATLRFERLTPFKIALSCTLASVNSNYKDSSIAAMKELILEEIDFREKSEADHWIAASLTHTPRPPSYLLQTLKSISDTITITANSSAFETVVSTLISLAFSLVDAVKKDGSNKKGRPNTGVSSAAEAGREILSQIFCGVGDDDATTESIRRSIIKTLSQKCTGHAPNALEHSKLLSVLPKQHLFEFTGELVEWLGHLATGGLPPNAATTHLLPVLSSLLQKERQHLDVALVFAKKSLFSADITKRCAGASCLVALLGVSSTGSAEEEVVGYLKRCLTQQHEVRWAVYSAVCQALNDEEMDEAQGQKVAKGMERLIHSQLDRVLEIQELEEVRQARRARAAAGEGGLSQMTQGGGDDDNVVVCPFQFLRVIGSGGEEGMLGESDKASGSPTLASAKRRVDEPLSFLLLAATACVAKLGPDCPLAQDLAMIRQKAADCEVDHYLQWTRDDEENTPTVPGDNSREVATCLVVAGVAEALTVGLDLSTEVGKKQTLAFLHLRAEAIKEGMYLTVPSDDALRKAKKAPEGSMDGSKSKKKKAAEGKGSDSNMLQERAEKAIVDYLRSDFQQLLDGASPNILTLISDSVYSSLMAFGGAMKDENGKKMISSSQLHQRIIMAGDLVATENLTGRMIPAIALKLSPVLLSEFSANVQRKSARTGPKKNGGGSLCGSALTGFLSGLKKMAGEIDGLSMTPVTRVNALFTKAFELSGLTASEGGAEPEEKLQGFLDAFTAPLGGVPQDSQTSRQGGVFVELVSVDAQEEACLICDAVSCAAGLLSNPNTRVRQGARMLNAWQEPNIAFEVRERRDGIVLSFRIVIHSNTTFCRVSSA